MRYVSRTLLAGVATAALSTAALSTAGLLGGTALAQQIILVPGPEGQAQAGSDQRFMLVPAPHFQPGPEAQGRGADSSMAMELYRRGYQQGMSDAGRAGAGRQAVDPAAIERIGRELFERGYILGMMQAQIQAAAQQPGQPQAGQQQAGQAQAGQQADQTQPLLPQPGQAQAGPQGAEQQTYERPVGQTQADQPAGTQDSQQAASQQGGQQADQQAASQQSGQANLPPPSEAQAGPQGVEEQTYERPVAQAETAQQSAGTQDSQQPAGQQGGQQGGQQLVQAQVGADMPAATIKTEDSEQHGQYLVDDNGSAVYMFTADTPGEGYSADAESSCDEECAEAWPPVLTRSTPVQAMEGIDSEMLGTFQRQDGTMQVTYNGWPLYYFVEDRGADQPTGQDVESFGGEWSLVTPEGEKVGADK